jgi:hypothetical protein
MIALSLPCDGMDSSRRWFESHQSFCLFVYSLIASERHIWLLDYETVNTFIAK